MTKISTRALNLKSSNLIWILGLEKLNSLLSNLLRTASLFAITFYKGTWSYIFGPCCRFYPTCSEYSMEAYRSQSFLKATYLTFLRILKCHPFGDSGYDPVCKLHHNNKSTEMNKGFK